MGLRNEEVFDKTLLTKSHFWKKAIVVPIFSSPNYFVRKIATGCFFGSKHNKSWFEFDSRRQSTILTLMLSLGLAWISRISDARKTSFKVLNDDQEAANELEVENLGKVQKMMRSGQSKVSREMY